MLLKVKVRDQHVAKASGQMPILLDQIFLLETILCILNAVHHDLPEYLFPDGRNTGF